MTASISAPASLRVLESLYQLALGGCMYIDEFQPELIVSLAHSDIGPLRAIQTCWEIGYTPPFPATIRINFGVEKASVYKGWRMANGLGSFDWEDSSEYEGFHGQAWFGQEPDMQAELKAQMDAALGPGKIPARVLLFDEVSFGQTRAMAFGLLHGCCPQSELCFLAGTQDWSRRLGEDWLFASYPALWQELLELIDPIASGTRFPTELHQALKDLVVGSQDCRKASLAWEPLRAEHPSVRAWLEWGMKLEDCLGCSNWILGQISDYVRGRMMGELEPPSPLETHEPDFQIWPFERRDQLGIEIWKNDGVTQARWAEIMGVGEEEAWEQIQRDWQQWQQIAPSGFGPETSYRVSSFLLPHLPQVAYPAKERFLKIENGRILAQGYPGFPLKYEWIFEEGVGFIIDLTMPPDAYSNKEGWFSVRPDWSGNSYHKDLLKLAAGRKIQIESFPIRAYCVPPVEQMVKILDALDEAMRLGKKTLVHDKLGCERAGMVLGCYLARHGMEPRKALDWLNKELPETLIQGYRIPGTEEQYRFVLGWKRGM